MEGTGHRRWRKEKHNRKPKENRGDSAPRCKAVAWDKQETEHTSTARSKGHESVLTATRAATSPPRDSSLCNPVSKRHVKKHQPCGARRVLRPAECSSRPTPKPAPSGRVAAGAADRRAAHAAQSPAPGHKAGTGAAASAVPILIQEGRSTERNSSTVINIYIMPIAYEQ